MEIIEPSVKLVAMSYPVIPTLHNLESIIELAGRTCYASQDKITDDSCLNFCDKIVNINHHESIAEHSSATFSIVCSRAVMAEITRHRLASYSIQSQRYVNYNKKGLRFIKPSWLSDDEPSKMWIKHKQDVEMLYNKYLELGWKPEQARDDLPNCTATEIVMTANLREWKHFLKLRTAPSAYSEMRVVANMIKEKLNKLSPTLFKL